MTEGLFERLASLFDVKKSPGWLELKQPLYWLFDPQHY